MTSTSTSIPDIFKQSPVMGTAYHPIFKGMATVLMVRTGRTAAVIKVIRAATQAAQPRAAYACARRVL